MFNMMQGRHLVPMNKIKIHVEIIVLFYIFYIWNLKLQTLLRFVYGSLTCQIKTYL